MAKATIDRDQLRALRALRRAFGPERSRSSTSSPSHPARVAPTAPPSSEGHALRPVHPARPVGRCLPHLRGRAGPLQPPVQGRPVRHPAPLPGVPMINLHFEQHGQYRAGCGPPRVPTAATSWAAHRPRPAPSGTASAAARSAARDHRDAADNSNLQGWGAPAGTVAPFPHPRGGRERDATVPLRPSAPGDRRLDGPL